MIFMFTDFEIRIDFVRKNDCKSKKAETFKSIADESKKIVGAQ